jgi:hypothetical protein
MVQLLEFHACRFGIGAFGAFENSLVIEVIGWLRCATQTSVARNLGTVACQLGELMGRKNAIAAWSLP